MTDMNAAPGHARCRQKTPPASGQKAGARLTRFALLLAVPLFAVGGAGGTSPSLWQYGRDDLPAGGTFLQYADSPTQFYFVPADAIAGRRENFGKRQGLYFGPNANGKFALFTDRFDFRDVFIHPVTRKLFAIIRWREVCPGPDGFLVARDMGAIATSDDALRWKDLTPPDFQKGASLRAAILNDVKIQRDPGHRNRICVVRSDPFGFVLRATDDAHAKWEIVPMKGVATDVPGAPADPPR